MVDANTTARFSNKKEVFMEDYRCFELSNVASP